MKKKYRILQVMEDGRLENFTPLFDNNYKYIIDFTELHDTEELALAHTIKYNLSYFTILPIYI